MKHITKLIKMLSNGATFDYSSARFSLEAIDFNHSKTVVLLLHARGFYHYLCHDNLYLGMDLHTMTNVLRCVNNDDSTTTEVDHHGDIVAFTFQDSGTFSFFQIFFFNFMSWFWYANGFPFCICIWFCLTVLDKISHFVLWLMDVERKPI